MLHHKNIKPMKLSSMIVFLLLALQGMAQSGYVEYTEAIKIEIDVEGLDARMQEMIPTSQTTEKILYFKESESLYKQKTAAEDLSISSDEDGNHFEVNFQMPESSVYINLDTDEYLHALEFLGKDFLITDKASNRKWKISGEQKKVLDYVCQKAVLVDDTRDVVAWFAPEIQIKMGPDGYSGLPGMILALELDGDSRKVVASKITMSDIDNALIAKPTKGKKIDREAYTAMREEKLKEMGAVDGGGAVRMIIVEEDDE